MTIRFNDQNKRVNDKRRENKQRIDMIRKGAHKQEVKAVFNTLYKDQIAELYKAIKGK